MSVDDDHLIYSQYTDAISFLTFCRSIYIMFSSNLISSLPEIFTVNSFLYFFRYSHKFATLSSSHTHTYTHTLPYRFMLITHRKASLTFEILKNVKFQTFQKTTLQLMQ
jgi:hypothetical protein